MNFKSLNPSDKWSSLKIKYYDRKPFSPMIGHEMKVTLTQLPTFYQNENGFIAQCSCGFKARHRGHISNKKITEVHNAEITELLQLGISLSDFYNSTKTTTEEEQK